MKKFRIEITSVPDREFLVAEIWYSDLLIAEINQENSDLEINFYAVEKITFNLNDLLSSIVIAKNNLRPTS